MSGPQAVLDATNRFREDSDVIGQWLKECCETAFEAIETAIHWDTNTFTVPGCKTAERTVPLFGGFRPLLEQHHQNYLGNDPLTTLSGPVFPNCPTQTQLTARLNRTIGRAGLQPWAKPWMNLRSSAETWLVRQGFDLTTVTRWLGNSPNIAQKHYLQVTPGVIKKAAGLSEKKFSIVFRAPENRGE